MDRAARLQGRPGFWRRGGWTARVALATWEDIGGAGSRSDMGIRQLHWPAAEEGGRRWLRVEEGGRVPCADGEEGMVGSRVHLAGEGGKGRAADRGWAGYGACWIRTPAGR